MSEAELPVEDDSVEDDSVEGNSVEGDSVERESEVDDALLSRLRVIEDQPLEARAAAFAQVHDELRSRLEGQ